MAFIPLIDCYDLLDLDPKTLRSSLKRLGITATPHPSDTRIKCLTTQQIEHLASLHARVLRPCMIDPSDATPRVHPMASSSASEVAGKQEQKAPEEESHLSQKVHTLETHIAQLSDQLAQLALHVLQQHDHLLETRLKTLETLLQERLPVSSPILAASKPDDEHQPRAEVKPLRAHQPMAAEVRLHSRLPPLIEYSPSGTYILVSSQEGELDVVPDSQAWFDWLASLTSFRFLGQQGRFSACRDSNHGEHTRSWVAHRSAHGQRYKHYLGVTDRLTLACLEQMAARLQAAVTSA